MPAPQRVVFASDYGLDDPFVGLCHAVIAATAPGVAVLDLVHTITRQDVDEGALLLHDSLPWLPSGVLLAVVDPGVGSVRRAVAICAGADGRARRWLVGPDNGLLWPAATALGGPQEAWELPPPRPGPVRHAHTFDGRDVFAPAAARLAAGADPEELGTALPVGELVRLELPEARWHGPRLDTAVLRVDTYGNVQLGARHDDLVRLGGQGATVIVEADHIRVSATIASSFADVEPGVLMLLGDAFGRLQLSVNLGRAATRLPCERYQPLSIRPA